MGILNRALQLRAGATLSNPPDWLISALAGTPTLSGVTVSESTALSLSAYYAGVRLLSEDLASLPLFVYERLEPRGWRIAREHPLFDVLHVRSNPEMTALQFREAQMAYCLTRGNAFAEIVRNGAGDVVELWPIAPTRVRIERIGAELVYFVNVDGAREIPLRADAIVHTRGFSLDGWRGLSLLEVARQSIGLGLAAEEYGARFFGAGMRPGGVLKYPGKLSPTARENLELSIEQAHSGLEHVHRLMVLEEGMDWQATGLSNEDAQFLESRRFQVTEFARWLRVPPHKLGELDRATFANIEQQSIDYVVGSLRPWAVRWEQQLSATLLSQAERRRFYVQHKLDGLLRGDTASRYAAYAQGRQWGWLSADDVRELENLNPLPDGAGEVYLTPLNMGDAANPPEPAPAGTPAEPLRVVRRRRSELELRARSSMRADFASVFSDAAVRLVAIESREVRKLESNLEQRTLASWEEALDALYRGELRGLAERIFGPAFATYARLVGRSAAAEVNAELPDLGDFVAGLVAAFGVRYTESSRGQLLEVAGANAVDPIPALRARLEEWAERRPARVAARETVQAENAVAREVWTRSGVERIRWRASGKTCPICTRLDGQVRTISETFAKAGEKLERGEGQTITVRRDVGHPPVHGGCDCTVEPA